MYGSPELSEEEGEEGEYENPHTSTALLSHRRTSLRKTKKSKAEKEQERTSSTNSSNSKARTQTVVRRSVYASDFPYSPSAGNGFVKEVERKSTEASSGSSPEGASGCNCKKSRCLKL